MRLHLPSFCDVTSKSDKICPVEPGRHSGETVEQVNQCNRINKIVTDDPQTRADSPSVTLSTLGLCE